MKKRLISIALVICIISGLCAFDIMYTSASSSYVSPNMAILENILYGDRQFVIDTLIGKNYKANFSTNPHALVNNIGNENAMMDNVLSQYRNENDPNYKASYKLAVDIMEKVYNGSDYVQHATDWVTSFAADLLSIFSSDAQAVMDDLTHSVGELRYESILKEVLSSDYTSSNGTTLSTKEIELENLERLNKGLQNLRSFSSFFKSDASANHMGDGTFDDRMDYYNKFLIPYADSLENVLNQFANIQGTGEAEDIASFITALAMVSQMDRFESANEEISSDIVYYAPTFFIDDDALAILKNINSSLSTVTKTLSAYMFINSIATQKEAVGDTLTRMSYNSTNADLNSILTTFANEIGKAGNTKLMGYESLMYYLRNAGVATEFGDWAIDKVTGTVSPYVEKFICDNLGMAWQYSNAGLAHTALSTVLSKATGVADISSWCADKTMSFGDTCKKTYELKYLERIIRTAVDTYYTDVNVYLADKTEENAEDVLDDLLMIQKLRLRGETIAYNMTYGQWNSPLGRLLANGTLNKDDTLINHLTEAYQKRVDTIIGASAMPFTSNSLTVNNGEILTLCYEQSKGGLYGIVTDTGLDMRAIGELKYKVASGITVQNGGEILMLDIPTAYIPYIVNNGGLVQFAGSARIDEYTQNSGIVTLGANTSYINSLHLNGGTLKSVHRDNLSCKYLDNSGGTATLEIPLYCNNLSVKGNISGSTVYLSGDSEGGGGVVQNLYLSGTSKQTIKNSIGAENLTYNNSAGVIQEGTVKVSGTLKNINTKLKNAKNTVIVDGGRIDGGYYKQDITVGGKISNDYVEFDSVVYVSGTASINSAKINNMIYQSYGSLNINGDIEIVDSGHFKGSVTQNAGEFILKGDASFSDASNLNNLSICGNKVQTISGAVTVNDYTNNNTAGLSIGGKINVKGKATSVKAPTSGASNVTLISDAGFASDKYYGDVSLGNLNGSIPDIYRVYGNIYVTGNVTQTKNTTLYSPLVISGGTFTVKDTVLTTKNKISVNSGTLSLQNSTVKCYGAFHSPAKTNIDNLSRLEVYADFNNSGTFSSNGTLKVSGDISNNGTLNTQSLLITTEADRTVSGTLTANYFEATGSKSITLNDNINVTDGYNVNQVKIDTTKIKQVETIEIINKSVTYDALQLSGSDLVVSDNAVVKCNGKFSITNGNITVSDNSTLMVRKNADLSNVNITLDNNSKLVFYSKFSISGSSSNSITIDASSSLTSKNLMNVNTLGSITVNGKLILGGDAMLTSTALSGSGTATLYGDLYTTSSTSLLVDTFKISGKFAQRINGSGLKFNNLTVNNNSSAGVTFDTATYKGELKTGNSTISGTLSAEE